MSGIKETTNKMIQFVFPEHTNNNGTLHGGRLMDWIMLIGSITSSRYTKSATLLGATDSIDFINPQWKLSRESMLKIWKQVKGSL